MKFKKILFVYSEKESLNHVNFYLKIQDYFNEKGFDINYISVGNLSNLDFSIYDLVISFGGGGTFIRVSHYLKDLPILGINSDSETSEGGLCSLDEENFEDSGKILEGKYKSIFRNRIDIFLNGKLILERALNEVYVGTKNQFHTSRYVINFKEGKEEHRSSGALISTGSGSNVWYKSAGGKSFGFNENKLKFLVREPFVSRLFEPKLLEGEILKEETISFDSKRCYGGIIALDSNVTYNFNEGDKVKLKISDFPLEVLEKI